MKKILFLLPLLLIGCKISQKIVYRTDDLSVPNGIKTFPIFVDLRLLKDNRAQTEENNVLFTAPRQTKLNGENSCINSEQHYKKDSVTMQITRIIAEHFNKAKLFYFTTYNKNNSDGYYITGTLNSFYGEQKFSTGAAVGAQFGFIGAIATSGIKTPGKIIIEISDLKLFNKDGVLIKDFGSFYKDYNEDLHADAYCWCIYGNLNEKLKDYNSHLAEKIRSDLADIYFQ
jgi:hypothetical protein